MKEFRKALTHIKKKDPAFSKLAERHKDFAFEFDAERSPYQSLVRSISHQQLHGAAAQAILGRLIAKFPKQEFPRPEDLVRLADTEFRSCGYSASKTKAIKDIAQKTLEGIIPDRATAETLSNQELIERMTAPFGVGQWTVEMFLIFGLGRLDVWPVDDYGVKNGFRLWKRKADLPKARALFEYGERWRPYRTIVALFLWREADAAKAKVAKAKKSVKKKSKKG